MTDEAPPMKPQDQTLFLLGQMSGQLTAMQSSMETFTTTQSGINAELRTKADQALAESAALKVRVDVIDLRTATPPKTPTATKVAIGLSIPASVVALFLVIRQYLGL